jgi:hypothetical protein
MKPVVKERVEVVEAGRGLGRGDPVDGNNRGCDELKNKVRS